MPGLEIESAGAAVRGRQLGDEVRREAMDDGGWEMGEGQMWIRRSEGGSWLMRSEGRRSLDDAIRSGVWGPENYGVSEVRSVSVGVGGGEEGSQIFPDVSGVGGNQSVVVDMIVLWTFAKFCEAGASCPILTTYARICLLTVIISAPRRGRRSVPLRLLQQSGLRLVRGSGDRVR